MKKKWEIFCRFLGCLHPARVVALGYLSYIFVGWFLLALPFSHARGQLPFLDILFTSVSAVSTTGLVTLSTGNDFNMFGQIVILLLVQMGGIGYMTLGSFIVLSKGGTALSDRREEIGKIVFSMPEGFRIDKFLKSVVVFTIITEAVGAWALYWALGRTGVENPLWSAIFHSVSAFCTAGFCLYDDSFSQFRGDAYINTIIISLSCLGAIGFIVLIDGWRRITRKIRHITLTSRIILVTTLLVSFFGAVLFFTAEPTLEDVSFKESLNITLFQIVEASSTAGFNSVPIGELSKASLFLLIILMIVGASPSGTGGGLKTTTCTAVFGVIRSAIFGRKKVTFWGREIPDDRIRVAIASLGFYTATLVTGCYLLALTQSLEFESLLFEVTSALSTVGLSTGITPHLTAVGKLIIIAVMFAGRMGPLAFGLALFFPFSSDKSACRNGREDLAV